MLVYALRKKADIKSIINRKWENCSTNRRPDLAKVGRFRVVYQQGESVLKDKDANLLWNRNSGGVSYEARLF